MCTWLVSITAKRRSGVARARVCVWSEHADSFIADFLQIVFSFGNGQAHANMAHFHVARLTIVAVCRSIWFAADRMHAAKITEHSVDWIMAAPISSNQLWTHRLTLLIFAVSELQGAEPRRIFIGFIH